MIKIIKKYLAGLTGVFLIGGLISSCEKTFDEKTIQQQDFSNSPIAQLVIATMNAAGNHLLIDAKQVTGSVMATGAIFPTTGHGFVVNPGLRAFLVTGSGTQQPLSFAENLQGGKHYSIFLYDTITTPKQKTVVDDIVIPADTSSRLRIANFAYSPNAIPNIDVFSFVANANIVTNLPTTGVTSYIPYPSFKTDTLYFRDAGSSTTFLKVTLSSGVTPKRSYTLMLRGSYRANARTSTLIANR